MYALAPRRHRKRRGGHHRRRRNASRSGALTQFASGGMLKTVGGAAVGFLGANALPALIPQLAQYNVGLSGYGLQLGAGLLISWGAKRFFGPQAGYGALIGTGLAMLLRAIKDYSATTGSITAAAMSGDLAYYGSDRFPYPQGSGGPYLTYPGNPSLENPPFPATSAAAVRAGAAAAGHAMAGIAGGRWGVTGSGDASRWT